MSAEVMLVASGIVNRFGTQLVHDGIDLEVFEGEILGIAGGSGSGKSVLLRTLTGLRKPDAGQVLVDKRPIETLSGADMAALVGVLFQQGALFSSLTIAQNIMLPMREHTRIPEDQQRRIAAMKLELAGLDAATGAKFPAELSGGMVKRAALARAIALDPRLLFLDEPTSDLDPINASGIDALILKLNESLALTVVMVTHDLVTLFTTCTRVALLVEGRMHVGTIEELKGSGDPWIHDFLNGPRAQGLKPVRSRKHGNG